MLAHFPRILTDNPTTTFPSSSRQIIRRPHRPQLDVQSQLIIIHLARLQQTPDLHRALALLISCFLSRLLAVLGEQVRVVARELLELDQEIPQRQFEPVDIVGLREEVGDEALDLRSEREMLAMDSSTVRW